MGEIDAIRNRITSVDRQILQALAERRRLAVHVLQAKARAGVPVRDTAREERVLEELIAAGRDVGLDAYFVTRIFHEIIDDALRSQQTGLLAEPAPGLKRVAYQGIEGAYSEVAARLYGLHVLRRNVEDHRDNFTRFVIVARQAVEVDVRVPCKTSLVMATPHEAGALLKALSTLRRHEVNLLKLESRPIPGMPFQYRFHLDLEGNTAEPRCAAAPAQAAYRLAGRGNKPEDTVVEVRGVRIGGKDFVVIAGPCAVESRGQIRLCARQVRECGAHLAVQLPGPGPRGPAAAGRSRRGVRAAGRDRGALPDGCRSRGAPCRHLADRRPQHAEFQPAGRGGALPPPGAPQARHDVDHRGIPERRRIHTRSG